MSGYLKQKMAVASFVQDLSRLRTLYRLVRTTKRGREAKPKFWLASCRFMRTQAMASARRSFCFETAKSGKCRFRTSPPRAKPHVTLDTSR